MFCFFYLFVYLFLHGGGIFSFFFPFTCGKLIHILSFLKAGKARRGVGSRNACRRAGRMRDESVIPPASSHRQDQRTVGRQTSRQAGRLAGPVCLQTPWDHSPWLSEFLDGHHFHSVRLEGAFLKWRVPDGWAVW